jgi:ATP-dependent helicase/nuclease subunit A
MSTLHIYRASAGSGKTFTLTRRYLEKALADPQNFSRIAALTFTNKATAEMKARIFSTLNTLARGENTQHTEYLAETLELTPAEITVRADLLRRYILADYKDFTVTTLDKFFQRILRSFAREINVDTGYEPELDYGRVMDEIVNNITEELRPGMPLTDWISEYLVDKLEEGKSRDFRSVIKGLGMKIFDEDFRSIAHELKGIEDTYQTLREFKNSLYQDKNKYEEQIAAIGQQALALMERYDLVPEDFTGGSRSAFRYFRNWASGEVGELKDSFLKLQAEAEKWYAKSAPSDKKEAIQAAYHNGLFDIVNQVVQFYASHQTTYRSLTVAAKNLFVFGIFSELVKKLEDYREENNVLLLADAVDILRNLTGMDDASFVYEKTGTRYDVYLLDEFQDTSGFQWDCTVPLISNTLAEGNMNLLVGDPKQSIYRWRGGDRELINSKVAAQFENHQIHQLDTNFRSRKNIIGFNNSIFSLLPELIFSDLEREFGDRSEVNNGLELLRCTYSDVVQQWSGKDEGGYANVRFFEKDETSEENEDAYAVDQALVETVKSMQDRGFKAKDIAVLVRKNSEAKLAADILQAEKWKNPDTPYVFDIISDEASYLENSSALGLLIHIAQFMLNPVDAVNNSGLLLELNAIQPIASSREELVRISHDVQKVRELLPKEFTSKDAELSRKAPGPLFDSLIRIFGLNKLSDEFSYLAAFRDLVTDFSSSREPDLNSFLHHWHEKGRRQSVKAPDDAEAIRIMTFHKCKGLEFEAVIIPFFSEKTDHSGTHTVPLWVKSDEKPFDALPYFPVDYGSALKQTIFAESYFKERLEAVSDALNLAYVAFTRAKTELHIFAQKPREGSYSSPLSNLGYLMYHVAQTKPPVPSGGNFVQIYTDGDADETGLSAGEPQTFIREEKDNKQEIEKVFLPSYPTTEAGERLKLRMRENPAFYSMERRKGILLHLILSELRYESDTENLINRLTAAGQLTEEEKIVTLEGMKTLLTDADVKLLFSPDAEIKTEAALVGSNGHLFIPDRIAILDDGVIVGDFKTGKKEAEHETQLLGYMQLIRDLGYKNVRGVLLYTATGETQKFNA